MGVDEQMVGLSRVGVFEGGTVSYREVTSSWFDSEEGREAALNHQRVNMNMYPILICFLLTLQDGNTGLINSEKLHTGIEGGNITVMCTFYFPGRRKLFCKEECTTGNILIETTNDRAQRDGYSIEYEEGFYPRTSTVMYVSITQLKKSDSGWYTCGLDRTFGPDGYEKFELLVTEASTTLKPNFTLRPSTTSSSSASTETTKHPETESPAGSAPSGYFLVLVVCLAVVVSVLLTVVLLFLCKKKRKDSYGSNLMQMSDQTNMEVLNYENCPPVSMCEDSCYQSLDPVTRDQNQIYSTLTQI
ncbi:transmembrane domain-containing protein TMIGD3-like isoform X1 [Anabas testudineus]|uniref:transmembrane domain-containing protein TMIGD3-like isoform X1 n=1 Tax=Anabas testudineus TaxID=64144 RepID=UPI000E45DABF|nr:transmembrane domain-containing protein TMIGD3-like isoform X1 [Anabas testudineus]